MDVKRYVVGSTVRVRPYGRGSALFVVAPSGNEFKLKLRDRGSIDLWLPELGTWVLQWEVGEPEQIEVVADERVPAVELELPPPKPTHALSST